MSEENKKVDKIAKDIEFVMEEAAIYLENDVVGFDFDKLEDRFGEVEELEELRKEIESSELGNDPKSIELAATQSWKSCMIDALKDHFGVALIEAALTGGLWGYLKKKAWKEAAKLLLKIGIGGNAAGLVAVLTYYSGKCAL